jgi:hypothetical protein
MPYLFIFVNLFRRFLFLGGGFFRGFFRFF